MFFVRNLGKWVVTGNYSGGASRKHRGGTGFPPGDTILIGSASCTVLNGRAEDPFLGKGNRGTKLLL